MRYLNHFPRVRPVSLLAALRPMRFPTLPFLTALTSPMSLVRSKEGFGYSYPPLQALSELPSLLRD